MKSKTNKKSLSIPWSSNGDGIIFKINFYEYLKKYDVFYEIDQDENGLFCAGLIVKRKQFLEIKKKIKSIKTKEDIEKIIDIKDITCVYYFPKTKSSFKMLYFDLRAL